MAACASCQSDLPDGALQCLRCGEWVSKADARHAAGQMDPALKVFVVALVVMIVAILVRVVVF